jgi:imidazolonepropionase-like amidohydrolase
VQEAIKAVTIDAAWQCQREKIIGSLEVGKYADLVVLEDDPNQVDQCERNLARGTRRQPTH